MTKLSSQYDLISATPHPGGHASLWISDVLAQEVATAIDAGVGPTMPDAAGTPTPGTLHPGMVMTLNSGGYWEPATSPNLSTDLPIVMGFAHEGNEDWGGAFVGKPVILVGLAEMLTEFFNGVTFPPGTALVANAGKFEAKTSASSSLQVVGYVGNRGLRNGVLHVMFGVR